MKIEAQLRHVAVPMRRAFGHAQSRRSVSESVLISVVADGNEAVGECAPRPYVTGESVASVFEAITSLDLHTLEASLAAPSFPEAIREIDSLGLPDRLGRAGQPALASQCLLELMALDLAGKRSAQPLRRVAAALALPDALRPEPGARLRTLRALGLDEDVVDFVGALGGRIPKHIKIKVGAGAQKDVERVGRLRALIGDATGIGVDANMAWKLDEAVDALERLAPFRIAWCEEPLEKGRLDDYRALRRRTRIPIMLDESLCSLADAENASAREACDLFNVRVSKCGGFVASLRIIDTAWRHRLGFQIGCQVAETGVLTAAARHLVGSVRGAVAYEGANPARVLESSLVLEDLSDDRDYFCPDLDGNGLGVTLDWPDVERYTQRRASWRSSSGRWTVD